MDNVLIVWKIKGNVVTDLLRAWFVVTHRPFSMLKNRGFLFAYLFRLIKDQSEAAVIGFEGVG